MTFYAQKGLNCQQHQSRVVFTHFMVNVSKTLYVSILEIYFKVLSNILHIDFCWIYNNIYIVYPH